MTEEGRLAGRSGGEEGGMGEGGEGKVGGEGSGISCKHCYGGKRMKGLRMTCAMEWNGFCIGLADW